jgi:hypothetical protein
MTGDLSGIEAQARDITFLAGYAATLPETDMSEIAVGGFSWGGISNLFAASRDSRIKAFFALDGSMRCFPGLIKHSGYARPDQMRIPLLFFTQGDSPLEDQEKMLNDPDRVSGRNALNAWTQGVLITVRMLGMTHGEFSSMFQQAKSSVLSGLPTNRPQLAILVPAGPGKVKDIANNWKSNLPKCCLARRIERFNGFEGWGQSEGPPVPVRAAI